MDFITLKDEDSFVLEKKHDLFLHKCCDCGLMHEVYVEGRTKDLVFKFKRIDELEKDKYENIGVTINKKEGVR